MILITTNILSKKEISTIYSVLDSYEIPNNIYFIKEFEYTANGKIHRDNTKSKAINLGILNTPDQ